MKRTCSSMAEIASVFNHNTTAFAREIKRLNQRCGKLERKRGLYVWVGVLFGAAFELCMAEQNQRIAALDEEICKLSQKIERLEDREGD